MTGALLARAVVQLGSALLYAWILAALGRRLLRRLPRGGVAERLGLDFAAGYAAFGFVLFWLGLLGWITRGPLLVLLGGTILLCAGAGLEVARDAAGLLLPGPGRSGRRWWGRRWWSLAVPFGLVVAPMLVIALYPPTGYDALNYHLPYVASFVEAGRLTTDWTLRFPVFPQLVELVISVPYLFVGESAAESFLLAPTFAVAIVVGAWAARAGGRSSGPIAAAIWLGSPLVVWLSARAYVDHSLALFVVSGLYALEAWRSGRGREWLPLAGVLVGSACACKYLGLPWAVLAVVFVAVAAPARRRVRDALVVSAVAVVVAGPWYARVARETGSPVFPYLPEMSLYASADPASARNGVDADRPTFLPIPPERDPSPFRSGVTGVLALPFSVTWVREAFDRQAPMTPWALPLFLLVLWSARRDRTVLVLLAASVLFCFTLLAQSRIALRFVLTPAAVLSVAGAISVRPLLASALRRARRPVRAPLVRTLTLLAFVGFGAAYGLYKIVERGVPPSDEEGRRRHLIRWVPGYEAVDFLNRELGTEYTAYGLDLPSARYFADGHYLGDWFGVYPFPIVEPLLGSPARLHRRLRAWGVDHLVASRELGAAWDDTPCFHRIWRGEGTEVFRLAGEGTEGCVPSEGRGR